MEKRGLVYGIGNDHQAVGLTTAEKTCPWNAGHHQPVVIIPRGDA